MYEKVLKKQHHKIRTFQRKTCHIIMYTNYCIGCKQMCDPPSRDRKDLLCIQKDHMYPNNPNTI